MTLTKLQRLVAEWAERNFGHGPETGNRTVIGVVEETGELLEIFLAVTQLCHFQLKGEQGIRYNEEEVKQLKMDAIGDIVIYLSHYCESQGLSLNECVRKAWAEVKERNWKINSKTGKVEDDGWCDE